MLKNYIALVTAAQSAKERGAAMPEYGLLVALIAVVVLAGAQTLGLNLLAEFNDLAGNFGN